jgi:hypothetical protein
MRLQKGDKIVSFQRTQLACSGVLLNNRFVLTNGKCAINPFTKLTLDPSRLSIVVPAQNRTRQVIDIQLHPDFQAFGVLLPHNLALLQLTDDSDDDESKRLCVSSKADKARKVYTMHLQSAIALYSSESDALNWSQANVTQIPLQEHSSEMACQTRNDQFCGRANVASFSNSDVGAPLLIHSQGQFKLIAMISSFNENVAIATRLVSKNLSWLQSTLGEQLCVS